MPNDLYIPNVFAYFSTQAASIEEAREEMNALCDMLEEKFGLTIVFETRGLELRDANGDEIETWD